MICGVAIGSCWFVCCVFLTVLFTHTTFGTLTRQALQTSKLRAYACARKGTKLHHRECVTINNEVLLQQMTQRWLCSMLIIITSTTTSAVSLAWGVLINCAEPVVKH